MTTQTIRAESLSANDWRQIFTPSPGGGGDNPHEDETSTGGNHSIDDFDSEDIKQFLSRVVLDILKVDPDVRLDYLRSVNPSLTEEHRDAIAVTTYRWLNAESRERIRTVARSTYENGLAPDYVLVNWTTSEEINRLIELLQETSVPDKTLAVCYTMSAAYDTGRAAYLLHRHRVERQVDFTTLKQTPEEIADDVRFANLR